MAQDLISKNLTQATVQNFDLNAYSSNARLPANADPASGNFSSLLDNQMKSDSQANSKLLEFAESFSKDAMGNNPITEISGKDVKIDMATAKESLTTSPGGWNMFMEMIKKMNSEEDAADRLLETMSSGKKYSTQELLRYQVMANESGVLLETFSKAGEALHHAISTPYNMNVG